MRSSFKTRDVLGSHQSLNRKQNRSIKSLDKRNKLKQIIECEKTLVSKSTRNMLKAQEENICSPNYFKRQLLSASSQLKIKQNKQNIKFPLISKEKHTQPLKRKTFTHRAKKESNKKLLTQPPIHFQTINEQSQLVTDIKETLMHILKTDTRKSITLQAEIDKLSQLTKKGTFLRKHLISIQEDMLSLNLKRKISKIYTEQQCSLLE